MCVCVRVREREIKGERESTYIQMNMFTNALINIYIYSELLLLPRGLLNLYIYIYINIYIYVYVYVCMYIYI